MLEDSSDRERTVSIRLHLVSSPNICKVMDQKADNLHRRQQDVRRCSIVTTLKPQYVFVHLQETSMPRKELTLAILLDSLTAIVSQQLERLTVACTLSATSMCNH